MPTIDLYIHMRIDAADPPPLPLTSQNVKTLGRVYWILKNINLSVDYQHKNQSIFYTLHKKTLNQHIEVKKFGIFV